MSDLVLRDLDERLLEQLHQNAAWHGLTIEEEVKKIIDTVLVSSSKAGILERARAIRERNAHLQKTNTLELLREDRDNR